MELIADNFRLERPRQKNLRNSVLESSTRGETRTSSSDPISHLAQTWAKQDVILAKGSNSPIVCVLAPMAVYLYYAAANYCYV